MMNSSRVELQPAYVLHTKPYRNTSLIAEIFSQDHGRLSLVARGMRGGRGRRAQSQARLQPFRPWLLSWSGRGEMPTLSACEPHERSVMLAGAGLMSGYYLNELLLRLTHRHDPHPELFAEYHEVLTQLAGEGDCEQLLRRFELRLLDELGYGLILDHEVESGDVVQPQQRYCYHLQLGPVPERGRCVGISVSGATLLAMQENSLQDEEQRREAKRLMRAVLAQHLGDQPLKTRELFKQTRIS